jgi:hypothetical protein
MQCCYIYLVLLVLLACAREGGVSAQPIYGPAASCNVGAVGSNSSCCSLVPSDTPLFDLSCSVWTLNVQTFFFDYNSCVNVADCNCNQGGVDSMVPFFDTYNCYNGAISSSPGQTSFSAPSLVGFIDMITQMHCQVPMTVNGAWSGWSWGICSSKGTQTATRECNNPAPYNGGANCTGNSTMIQSCVPPCGESSCSACTGDPSDLCVWCITNSGGYCSPLLNSSASCVGYYSTSCALFGDMTRCDDPQFAKCNQPTAEIISQNLVSHCAKWVYFGCTLSSNGASRAATPGSSFASLLIAIACAHALVLLVFSDFRGFGVVAM